MPSAQYATLTSGSKMEPVEGTEKRWRLVPKEGEHSRFQQARSSRCLGCALRALHCMACMLRCPNGSALRVQARASASVDVPHVCPRPLCVPLCKQVVTWLGGGSTLLIFDEAHKVNPVSALQCAPAQVPYKGHKLVHSLHGPFRLISCRRPRTCSEAAVRATPP